MLNRLRLRLLNRLRLRHRRLEQRQGLRLDRLLVHLGERQDVVDDLVLEQRPAQRLDRLRVLAKELDHLRLLAGIALRLGAHRPGHLVGTHRDRAGAADLGEQQAKPHPALGDRTILGAQRLGVLAAVLLVAAAFLLVLLDALPDRVELGLHHALRRRKLRPLGQRVEQLALDAQAGELVVLGLYLLADHLAQLIEGLETDLAGERVVERHRQLPLQRLGGELERRRLAGQLGRYVLGRKGHVDAARLTRLEAGELLGEAGDEAVTADLHLHVAAVPALKRHAVDLADEIDGDDFADLGAAILGDRHQRALPLGEGRQRSVNHRGRRLGLEAGERDCGEIGRRDLRQQLHLDPELEVGRRRLSHADAAHHVDARLAGGAQAALGEHLARRVVDAFLQHLGHHRIAVALAHQARRHAARTKAGQLQTPPDLRQLGGALALDVGSRDDHGEAALQPLGKGFGDLHRWHPLRERSLMISATL